MRWVALLRAVNLGARNKVPMAELRTLLGDAGYGGVRTYIASGNVLLDGPEDRSAVVAGLERLIADAFGVSTTAIVRAPEELAAVVAAHPFGADTSHSHVVFLAGDPGPEAAERLASVSDADPAVLAGADVYVQYAAGVQGSRLSGAARAPARGACDAPQLAHRDRTRRARRRGVGSRHTRPREDQMALARVVSFDGVDSQRVASLTRDLQEGEPPEGMPAAERLLLHDPDGDQALAIVLFENEDDYRKGDEILGGMPAAETPGRRTSVTKYQVAARMTA